MSSMGAKKSFLNAISGILGQVITIIFGFYIPRLVIIGLGSESNGLFSSIGNVIAYLNLLEAGIGLASLQALYGPVSRLDIPEINSILSATKQYYQKIGIYYGFGILVIAAVYPVLVHTDIPVSTVVTVILLSGLPNVINFYFQGKYKVLLQADGKSYILNNITTVSYVITSFGKVILLNSGFGLKALQLFCAVVGIAQMAVIEWYIHKYYGWIDLRVQPNLKPLMQRNSVLIHQISGLIFSSTDAFILSMMCGLKTTSIYAVYTMLFGTISKMMRSMSDSVSFIMGQTFHKDRDEYLRMYRAYEVYNITFSFSLFTIANIFVLPFLKIYTAGAEVSYVDQWLPYLFIMTYLLENGRVAPMNAIIYAGHFKQTRWHAVVEMLLNLSVSIFGVYKLGIYGVLLGTIAALLFRGNIMIYYGCKKVLNIQMRETYWIWGTNFALFAAATVMSNRFFSKLALDSYIKVILWAIPTSLIWVSVFFIVESLLNKKAFEYIKPFLISQITKRIIH